MNLSSSAVVVRPVGLATPLIIQVSAVAFESAGLVMTETPSDERISPPCSE